MATDIFQHLQELPYRRYVDVLRNKVNDANNKLDAGIGAGVAGSGGAYLDQYPGKRVPWFFSKLYTVTGMIKAGTIEPGGVLGFSLLAPYANPAVFLLPRGDNILTGREAAFYWCSTTVAALLSWTYVSNPGFASPINPMEPGDIFDPAIQSNGGGQVIQNFGGTGLGAFPIGYNPPKVCFEIDMYDQKRGRSITDGRVPAEVFLGGAYEFKEVGAPVRFDVDSQIEPRVYFNEVKMSEPTVSTAIPFNASRVKVYLNILWKGYYALDQKRGEAP